VIVNDMSEINVDAELVRAGDAAVDHADPMPDWGQVAHDH
jgi:hypothetical protein